MSTTFGQLKSDVRQVLFPQGESSNLVIAHNKFFVDALMDLQTWVECLQQDNVNLFPQCSTFYKCGVTVLEAPRGRIKSVSVVPNLDRTDPASEPDWCGEIFYTQVSHCHIDAYIGRSQRCGALMPCGLFFALPGCLQDNIPVPTNEGVPAGLPALELGYSYPQTSTDRVWHRRKGVWAIERGKIYIVPWINSWEQVVIKWDGLKRSWGDSDLVDDDPMLSKAVEEYVRWKHSEKYEKEFVDAQAAQVGYNETRATMMHECREETRLRACEPSLARASSIGITNLYYNTEQIASAACPAGSTGDPVTVTIPAGTVSSTISIADANIRALNEAQSQAQARLVCQQQTVTYENVARTATATCPGDDTIRATITVPAGTISSTVSQQDADDQAYALALSQAEQALVGRCIWWNVEKTVTVVCASDSGITASGTVAAHTFSSASSQAAADQQATVAATNIANQNLALVCAVDGLFWNTQQTGTRQRTSPYCVQGVTVTVVVPAHSISSVISIADANQTAINTANSYADVLAQSFVISSQSNPAACGFHQATWGVLP